MFNPNIGVPVGILQGRPLFCDYTHALTIAPAGSGKGVSGSIPELVHGYGYVDKQGCYQTTSVIATDFKSELSETTSRCRRELHQQEVLYLNPDDVGGLGSVRFNPLQFVLDDAKSRKTRKYCKSSAEGIVAILIPEPKEGDKNSFFRNGSRNMLVTCTLWLALHKPEECTLPELFRIVSSAERLKAFLETAKNSTNLKGDIALLASGLLSTEEDHFADFLTGAFQAVSSFSPGGPLADIVSQSDFSFEDLKWKGMTVYFIVPYHRLDVYKVWLALVTKAALFSLALSGGNIPVTFVLDEATNFALPGLANDLTALRGVGGRVRMFIQAYSELERVFGKEAAKTISSQCNVKQYYRVSSLEEAKTISEMIGEYTFKTASLGADRTSPWSDLKDSVSEAGRLVMRPEEILSMPSTDQILHISGYPPIYCQRLPYNQVSPWYDWVDPNPVEGGKLPADIQVEMQFRRCA